ncbi:D-lactaldehyde dehydrogenase [Hysterangium stoloniferum]|nr:D-lactaldehyde dehydrogenase [Hysterangium stoloniferum]
MSHKSSKVLVSGASGFVASWITRHLLESGYNVRGTVRSPAKGEYLKNIHKQYGDKFEYVIVEDVQIEGAFDDAAKGMDYVVHTASPFHLSAEDPQQIIGPAVRGTIGILESIAKFAPDVKRVVVTSSTAAVTGTAGPNEPQPEAYNEKHWNAESPGVVEKEGKNASGSQKYRASKTLAERAAWDFVDKHQKDIKWSLVTMLPPLIFGPVIHQVSSPSSLNTSSLNFLAYLKNDPPRTDEQLSEPVGSFVDVRDVAAGHVLALENESLGNKSNEAAFKEGSGRMILSAGNFSWQGVTDTLVESGISLPSTVPRGKAGSEKPLQIPLDTSRALGAGLKFRSTAETFGDTLKNFREKGWVSE